MRRRGSAALMLCWYDSVMSALKMLPVLALALTACGGPGAEPLTVKSEPTPEPSSSAAAAPGEALEELEAIKMKVARGELSAEQALGAFEELLKRYPSSADVWFHHAVALSSVGHKEKALVSYDKAYALDETLISAQYNAGVVLVDLGRVEEALQRFEATAEKAPRHVDALYNAGQLRYNLGDFDRASEHWRAALKLAPKDFAIARKVAQADYARGHLEAGLESRARAREIWQGSEDERVRGTGDFVFDQFEAGKLQIQARETLGPVDPELHYHIVFVGIAGNSVVKTVQLESSGVLRENGVQFMLGMNEGSTHSTFAIQFEKMPPYDELKKLVIEVFEGKHQASSGSRPASGSRPVP